MNTIFLELTKKNLTQALNDILTRSKEADTGVSNNLLVTVNELIKDFVPIALGRDLDLSQSKRAQVDELQKIILNLKSNVDDQRNYAQLVEQIGIKKQTIFEMRGESNTTISLTNLEYFIRASYEKLKLFSYEDELLFLDIPYNDEPITQFRYAAAEYILEKIRENILPKRTEGHFFGFLNNSRRFDNLTQEKETILIDILKRCLHRLSLLDNSKATLLDKKKIVVEHIEEVRKENKRICFEKSTIFARYKPGNLEVLMNQTIERMSKEKTDLEKQNEPEKTVTTSNLHDVDDSEQTLEAMSFHSPGYNGPVHKMVPVSPVHFFASKDSSSRQSRNSEELAKEGYSPK